MNIMSKKSELKKKRKEKLIAESEAESKAGNVCEYCGRTGNSVWCCGTYSSEEEVPMNDNES